MGVNTYDPGKVIVSVAGVPLSGFAPDSMVEADREADTWGKVTGITGETARVRSRNKSGEFKVSLLQTSTMNDLLSAIHAADEATGAGIVPIGMTDLGGGTTLVSAEAWIRKPPPVTMKKEIETREWIFDCAVLDIHVAGNAPAGNY